MAHATTSIDIYPKAGVLARVSDWLARALDTIAENNTHLKRVRALQALSDAELAALGIARDDIVPVAFRDVYYH